VDVAKKKFELEKEIRQISEMLQNFALDVTSDEDHIRHLKKHTGDLLEITQKLNATLNDVMSEFERVSNGRKQRFNECLTAINLEIGKFCTIAMKGRAQGELKVIDNNEPFSSGVQFNWQVDGVDHFISDKSRNYDAAFAFLMGIIK
jgi:chromosome segregation ATPase